jgi:hypothetical protein
MMGLFWLSGVLLADPKEEAGRTLISGGVWEGGQAGDHLLVSVIPHVSQRQRDLVESGFSTFSQFELRILDDRGKLSDTVITRINCTAKFDLWQEAFEIVRLDENPKAITARSYEEYAAECFRVALWDAALLGALAERGGRLVASLFVDQISADKDAKIREWLIRQQSGVMQGLFAHMLGDLKLSQRIDVVIEVPKKSGQIKKKSA